MIQVIGTPSDKGMLAETIESYIEQLPDADGFYYRGFPIISTYDGGIKLDGLCCSEQYGVLIVHICEEHTLKASFTEMVDQVHLRVMALLSEVKSLMVRRKLIVPVRSVVYAPRLINNSFEFEEEDLFVIRNKGEFDSNIESEEWNGEELLNVVLSRLQSLSSLRTSKKRDNVTTERSKGNTLKKLECDLATLDGNQTRAVLENIDTVQRIRGLAGSGKTVVLARKVAFLHAEHEDWNIAVTFNTRSLKEQFKRLIDIFYRDAKGISPDWNKVQILHAWGSPSSNGVYYTACLKHNIKYYDYSAAKSLAKSGETEFQAVCQDWLDNFTKPKKVYDFILVDEAQDFTPEFLKLCYNLLGSKKRLVYAYDELQNLGDSSMPSPDEIWGDTEDGKPLVSFANKAQDIILDICYRNPGPVLTAAHALGFGIYRDPMIQMFDFAELWAEIGYEVKDGRLVEGEEVVLSRTKKSSPALLSSHNTIDEIIKFVPFSSSKQQSDWIASEILKNLREEELLPSDIVVIHPNAFKMRSEVGYLREKLFTLGVKSSIAGVTSSPDEFFSDDSVTFTSIYRAKGNEAAMVYILGAEWCNQAFELAKRRNVLFTAMTRTKAWLRVCGVGTRFDLLAEEYEKVKDNDFQLSFVYPTEKERKKMKVVNRDMTMSERNRVNQARSKAEDLTRLLGAEVSVHDIPDDVRAKLIRMLSEGK